MLNIWQHQKQQPQVAIKNLTCRPSWCRLDSSFCWSKKKPGLGSISHSILTIFFFSADWNSLFRKVRWSDIMNLKIVRAAQCVLLCFARFCKFCTATRRKAQLSCAWVKCGAENTMDEMCPNLSGKYKCQWGCVSKCKIISGGNFGV